MIDLSDDFLIDQMAEYKAKGIPFVVATVTRTEGSTPQKMGARMLVGKDGGLLGTVGGGPVESNVIERCKQLLLAPQPEYLSWNLEEEEAGAMLCGGKMEFFLEPFLCGPQVYIFGAGHCGQALARVLLDLRFTVTLVDLREPDILAPDLHSARYVQAHPGEYAASDQVPAGSFCVIVNPTHQYDMETLRGLAKKDLVYTGLMSSRRKKAEIFATLTSDGILASRLETVFTPVGLEIGSKTPQEIAISIAAEMISVLRGAPGHRREKA